MEIIKITRIDDTRNYWDITIPKNHNFVLEDGTIVHNCGTGVGFSIEKENVEQLPEIKHPTSIRRDDYVIEDSREGWANAFLFALQTWFSGEDVIFNFDKIRPYGAALKTMGGRASGPKPLKDLFEFTKKIITNAAGRNLTSLECHDISCKTAEIVVVGGTRRSALISFSDLEDRKMRHAKDFPIPVERHMANNSAVYKSKPDTITFLKEWSALAESGSGERGVINISNLSKICKTRTFSDDMRTNPCGEIILRPYEFCNLSEAVVRADDDISDLVEKVKTATWLGVIQSSFTYFPYLRDEWNRNCEEERLIGVSLTGQLDNPELLTTKVLQELKKIVIKTAKHAASILEINVPVAFTCTKPSGCCDIDTKIKTKDGNKTFKEIFNLHGYNLNEYKNKNNVWLPIRKEITIFNENNEEEKISKLFINGMENLYELEFEDDNVIHLTGNHCLKLKTGEWKRVKNLTENDDILNF